MRSVVLIATVLWASTIYVILWNTNKARLSSFVPECLTLHRTEEPPPTTSRRTLVESNVISFDVEKVNEFIIRNGHSFDGKPVLWVPGVDGFHQPVLNQWAKLVGETPVNASLFERNKQEDKDNHHSPHAVGCYLAHWHLLKSLQHRPPELRPELFFVFEDDTSCIPNLVNKTLSATRQLPSDWEMFYIGGKPYTDFPEGLQKNFSDSTESTLRRDICRGAFGRGTAPLAPDGSRQLSEDQPYWQIKCILNTHAYVVNPRRVNRIMEVLKPQQTEPIDQRLASAMERGSELNVYMSTQNWCSGEIYPQKMNEPTEWAGYFYFNLEKGMHPGARKNNVWQEKLKLENCSY